MKKLFLSLFLISIILVSPKTSHSQAFEGKGSKYFLAGIGISDHNAWYPEDGKGVKGRFSPISFNVTLQGEYGIGKYVGIGITAGFGYSNSMGTFGTALNNVFSTSNIDHTAWRSLGIPIGFMGNFHFLQLIADKTNKNFAEKMDVYAGASLGAGPSFAIPKAYNDNGGDVGYLLFVGPHVGIRFYPKSNFGIFAEAGFGKANLNGGICFKL